MLCDICKKREAKVYYTEIINGEKKEQHLCEECAAEHTSFFIKNTLNKELTIEGLISGMFETASGMHNKNKDAACPHCGMSYEEFLKKGKFGCADCYRSFDEGLGKLLKNIHGADVHCGKRAKQSVKNNQEQAGKSVELTEIERLTLKLQQAIEKEEFEEAAKLRDQIHVLKAEAGNSKKQRKQEAAEKLEHSEEIQEQDAGSEEEVPRE